METQNSNQRFNDFLDSHKIKPGWMFRLSIWISILLGIASIYFPMIELTFSQLEGEAPAIARYFFFIGKLSSYNYIPLVIVVIFLLLLSMHLDFWRASSAGNKTVGILFGVIWMLLFLFIVLTMFAVYLGTFSIPKVIGL